MLVELLQANEEQLLLFVPAPPLLQSFTSYLHMQVFRIGVKDQEVID